MGVDNHRILEVRGAVRLVVVVINLEAHLIPLLVRNLDKQPLTRHTKKNCLRMSSVKLVVLFIQPHFLLMLSMIRIGCLWLRGLLNMEKGSSLLLCMN